jgi:hypothetical protein
MVSDMRHAIVRLQTLGGTAKLPDLEWVETSADGTVVMFALIFVVAAQQPQPGQRPGALIQSRQPQWRM